jgi:hypothetical protein
MIERSRCRGVEVVAGLAVPAASSTVAGALGTMMATKISTYATDDSVGTLSEIQSHWFGLRWLEGRCETSNAEVVAGDLFATPNPLTARTEKNLLSPFSNIRAITAKLCTRSRLAFLEDHSP